MVVEFKGEVILSEENKPIRTEVYSIKGGVKKRGKYGIRNSNLSSDNISHSFLLRYLKNGDMVIPSYFYHSKQDFLRTSNLNQRFVKYVSRYAPELIGVEGKVSVGVEFSPKFQVGVLEFMKKEVNSVLPIYSNQLGGYYSLILPISNSEEFKEFDEEIGSFKEEIHEDYMRYKTYLKIMDSYFSTSTTPDFSHFGIGSYFPGIFLSESLVYDRVSEIDVLAKGLTEMASEDGTQRKILEDFLSDVSSSVELTKRARKDFENQLREGLRSAEFDFFDVLRERTSEFEDFYYNVLDRHRK